MTDFSMFYENIYDRTNPGKTRHLALLTLTELGNVSLYDFCHGKSFELKLVSFLQKTVRFTSCVVDDSLERILVSATAGGETKFVHCLKVDTCAYNGRRLTIESVTNIVSLVYL